MNDLNWESRQYILDLEHLMKHNCLCRCKWTLQNQHIPENVMLDVVLASNTSAQGQCQLAMRHTIASQPGSVLCVHTELCGNALKAKETRTLW